MVNGQNNIKNEFYIPKLVELEVLHVYTPSNTKKVQFLSFGNSAIRGSVADKHLGDFSCLGTH